MKLNIEHWSEDSDFELTYLQLDIIDILLSKNCLNIFIK
jgi:hypothetical protein